MTLLYDRTGIAPENFIQSEVVENLTTAVIYPTAGLFFLTGLVVTAVPVNDTVPVELVLDQDYKLSPVLLSHSAQIGQTLHSFIVVLDRAKWSRYELEYHALGGIMTDTVLADEIANLQPWDEGDPVNWLSVQGELKGIRPVGSFPILENKGYLEVFSSKLTNLLDALRVQPHEILTKSIAHNVSMNMSQDTLLALVIAANARQDVDIAAILNDTTVQQALIADLNTTNDTQTSRLEALQTNLTALVDRSIANQGINAAQAITIQEQIDKANDQDMWATTTTAGIRMDNLNLNAVMLGLVEDFYKLDITIADQTRNIAALQLGNLSQDELIEQTDGDITNLDVLIASNETVNNNQDAEIIDYQNRTIANADTIEANVLVNNAQNIAIRDLELDIDARQTAADEIDLTEVNQGISVNTSIIASNGLEVFSNQRANDLQDLNIQRNTEDLLNIGGSGGGASIVTLTSMEVTSRNALTPIQTAIGELRTINATQDVDIGNQQAELVAIENNTNSGNVTNIDIANLEITIADNLARIGAVESALDAQEIAGTAQDVRIGIVAGSLAVAESTATNQDVSGLELQVNELSNRTTINEVLLINIRNQHTADTIAINDNTIAIGLLEARPALDIAGLADSANANTTTLDNLEAAIAIMDANVTAQNTGISDNTTAIAAYLGSSTAVTIPNLAAMQASVLANKNSITSISATGDSMVSKNATQDIRISQLEDTSASQTAAIAANTAMLPPTAVIIYPTHLGKVGTINPFLMTSAFRPIIAGDTHVRSKYWIATDPEFTNIIYMSPETTDLLEHTVPDAVPAGVPLWVRAAHIGTLTPAVTWGMISEFIVDLGNGDPIPDPPLPLV